MNELERDIDTLLFKSDPETDFERAPEIDCGAVHPHYEFCLFSGRGGTRRRPTRRRVESRTKPAGSSVARVGRRRRRDCRPLRYRLSAAFSGGFPGPASPAQTPLSATATEGVLLDDEPAGNQQSVPQRTVRRFDVHLNEPGEKQRYASGIRNANRSRGIASVTYEDTVAVLTHRTEPVLVCDVVADE